MFPHESKSWFAFGEYDVVVISEMPTAVNAAAIAMAFAAGRTCKSLETTPLLFVEEAVDAMKKAKGSGYKPATTKGARAA